MQDSVQLRQSLELVKRQTPRPRRDFDQFTATTLTTAKRALLMAENGDLYRKKILFLGDDDLTSIACALLEPGVSINVLEIDRRLVSLIKEQAQAKRLSIRVKEFDLTKDLPREYLGKFDVVFTDPPYTPSGVGLFINQGILALKNSSSSRVYLCYGTSDKARERELVIQQIINERGLLIKSKLHAFNRYHGAQSIGSRSSIYVLERTPKTKVVFVEKRRLYTHE